ncbi:MAG: MBL fold metallo-hydrolase [Pseudomonadota bacterium]
MRITIEYVFLRAMFRRAFFMILALVLVSCNSTEIRRQADSVAANFDGSRFFNTLPGHRRFWSIPAFLLTGAFQKAPWPDWIETEPSEVPESPSAGALAVTFVNHSTMLLRFNGLTVLTDPIYSERASPFDWLGPKRVRAPGVRFEDLPQIDVVLISHNHYDHLDLETLLRLRDHKGGPLVLAGLGNEEILDESGIENYRTLDWGESVKLGEIEFEFVEVRHSSGRGILDQKKTLWGGFVVKRPQGAIYFAGDTGYGPHFSEIAERHGGFQLSMIPIGAYEPRSVMAEVHLNPAEAVCAHKDLRSEQSIGIHFGTFQLTYEGINEPVETLKAELARQDVAGEDFWVMGFGETRVIEPPD